MNMTNPTKEPTETPTMAPVVQKVFLEWSLEVFVIGNEGELGSGEGVVIEAILGEGVLLSTR